MRASDAFQRIGSWLREVAESSGVSRSALAALLLLVVGVALARLLGFLAKKLVLRLEQLLPSRDQADVDDALGRHRAGELIARVVFWIVLLVFVMAATEKLGLPVVTAWLSGITAYLPRLFFGLVVGMLGIVAGRIARRAVSRAASTAGLAYAQRLGRFAQAAVVIAALLVAIEQLGIDVRFVTTALMITLGSLLGGMALAFGLGCRSVVANILAGHYVRKLYDVGQVIRIDGVEGRIVRMTPTAVILEADDGEVAVPTNEIITLRSTLVTRGGL